MSPASLSIFTAAKEPGIGSRLALVGDGERLTYEALAARVRRVGMALAGAGARAGSRVGFVATANVETVVAILALAELGATLVPLHPRLTPPELDALAVDAALDLRLRAHGTEALEDLASSACGCLGGVVRPEDVFPRAHAPGAPLAMVATSGSTGRAKLAVLSRRAFAASAAASAERLGWQPDDRWLVAMPLAHVGGFSIVTRCVAARRTLVLEPRFEASSVIEAIVRERVTLLSVVPTMLAALLDADGSGAVLRSVRAMLVGGDAAPRALLDECARLGVSALTTYGLTELCSQVTTQLPREPGVAMTGSGPALSGVVLRIYGAEGVDAARGEVGRVAVGGPTRMSGYWQGTGAPLVTPFDADGLFDTGDDGYIDSADQLHIEGRRSDLVVTGGENVSPVEVERALEDCAGVRRALVFGLPDERWGQVVACALVLAEDAPFDPERVAESIAGRLAPHKRPRRFCVVDALPMASTGKLDRSEAPRILAIGLSPWPSRADCLSAPGGHG